MATIKYYLSRYIKKDDERGEIQLRFSGNRNFVKRAATGIRITAGSWDAERGTPRTRKVNKYGDNCEEIRDRLSQLSGYLLRCWEQADEGTVKPDALTRWMADIEWRSSQESIFINGQETTVTKWYIESKTQQQEKKMEEKKERKKIENKTFLDVYSYFIEEQYNNGVIGDSRHKTYYTCHSLWNRMERYQHKQYRVKDITTATIYDFRHFVLNECDLWEMGRVKDDKTGEMVDKLMPKKQYDYIYQGYEIMKSRGVEKRSLNYVVIQVKYLKAFWHWLMKIKKVGVEDIFLTYNMDQAVYGTPYYFTKKDREILYKADFSDNPELAIQRDIFVFQSLVGCRVGDLKRLKKSNIIDGEVLQYVAGKTKNKSGKIVTVPLHPIAQEIIKRYSIIEGDQLLPFIADQNYNEAIKKMFKKVDKIDHVVTVLDPVTRLEKQVKLSEVASSHMGRRNFCGNLYEAGYRDADIASMSGHAEGSRAIARYRKVSDERKKKMIKSL